MTPDLLKATYVDQYRIQLTFADGTEGIIDLRDELWGEVFEPLKDVEVFRSFRVNTELSTIEWPSRADLAPEFLYEQTLITRSCH